MAVINWSTVADENTSIAGLSIAEHCPAKNINDAIRSVMAEAKEKFNELDSKVATASIVGSGNAFTNVTASNGVLTFTKGETFLTSHQDITGKANLAGASFTGNVVTKGSFGTPVAVSGTDINLSEGTVFTKTVSADAVFTFTNAVTAKSSCFTLALTNGGAFTVSWPSVVKWAGGNAPELTASGTDIITFLSYDGGTSWFGVVSSLNAKA